jgi:hypothetical protein
MILTQIFLGIDMNGKGSKQRPTDHKAYSQAWEKIDWGKKSDIEKQYRDVPKGADGACGHPFCKCVDVCEDR